MHYSRSFVTHALKLSDALDVTSDYCALEEYARDVDSTDLDFESELRNIRNCDSFSLQIDYDAL